MGTKHYPRVSKHSHGGTKHCNRVPNTVKEHKVMLWGYQTLIKGYIKYWTRGTKHCNKIPNTVQGVPNTVPMIQKTVTWVQKTVTWIPNTVTGITNTITGVQNIVTQIPNTATWIPKTVTWIPNTITVVPNTLTWESNEDLGYQLFRYDFVMKQKLSSLWHQNIELDQLNLRLKQLLQSL